MEWGQVKKTVQNLDPIVLSTKMYQNVDDDDDDDGGRCM